MQDTDVVLTDVVIRDTLPQQSDLGFGRGLEAGFGARVTGTRVRVERSREIGVLAATGGVALLRDLSVVDVAGLDPPHNPGGHGVVAASGMLTMSRFEIRNALTCGLLVIVDASDPAALDIDTGLVSQNRIRACVQAEGFDLSRLMRDVTYRDNASNLDATTLPAPSAATMADTN